MTASHQPLTKKLSGSNVIEDNVKIAKVKAEESIAEILSIINDYYAHQLSGQKNKLIGQEKLPGQNSRLFKFIFGPKHNSAVSNLEIQVRDLSSKLDISNAIEILQKLDDAIYPFVNSVNSTKQKFKGGDHLEKQKFAGGENLQKALLNVYNYLNNFTEVLMVHTRRNTI